MREYGYDINKLISSKKARKLTRFIREKKCNCTRECAIQSSLVLNKGVSSNPQKGLPDEKPCSINKPSIGGNIVKMSYSVLGPACPSIQAFLKVSETSINPTIFGMDVFATILLEYPGNTP